MRRTLGTPAPPPNPLQLLLLVLQRPPPHAHLGQGGSLGASWAAVLRCAACLSAAERVIWMTAPQRDMDYCAALQFNVCECRPNSLQAQIHCATVL
jgi:hypothetical protein